MANKDVQYITLWAQRNQQPKTTPQFVQPFCRDHDRDRQIDRHADHASRRLHAAVDTQPASVYSSYIQTIESCQAIESNTTASVSTAL